MRWIVSGLVALMTMLPLGVAAEHDGTWHENPFPGGAGSFLGVAADLELNPQGHLHFQLDPDGVVTVHGSIVVSPYDRTGNLIATATPSSDASASCANQDGDSIAGIIGLSAHLTSRVGEPDVTVIVIPGHEVDEPGTYAAVARIISRGGMVISESQVSLRLGYVLSRDAYGSRDPR